MKQTEKQQVAINDIKLNLTKRLYNKLDKDGMLDVVCDKIANQINTRNGVSIDYLMFGIKDDNSITYYVNETNTNIVRVDFNRKTYK